MEQIILTYLKNNHPATNGCMMYQLCSTDYMEKDPFLLDMAITYVKCYIKEEYKACNYIGMACHKKIPIPFIQAMYDVGMYSSMNLITNLTGEHLDFALKNCLIDISMACGANYEFWNQIKEKVPNTKRFKYALFDVVITYNGKYETCKKCITRLLSIGADPEIIDETGKKAIDYLDINHPLRYLLLPKLPPRTDNDFTDIIIPAGLKVRLIQTGVILYSSSVCKQTSDTE